jgi:hypothetical protein
MKTVSFDVVARTGDGEDEERGVRGENGGYKEVRGAGYNNGGHRRRILRDRKEEREEVGGRER